MLFLETFSRFLGVLGTDHEKLTFYIRNTGSNYGKNPYRRGKRSGAAGCKAGEKRSVASGAGSIYGKSESGHKEGEPDVVGTFSVNRDENITVVANRGHIGDKEAFARELLQMYKDDSFYSTKFSTDRGYATSLDMNIYLWKEDIEDGESVMTAEYRPVEYGKDYDVVNNPDKFQLYIDGKEVEE